MRGIRVFGYGVCATLVAAAVTIAAIRTTRARSIPGTPRIELPEFMLDLGAGKAGEILDGVFQVANQGTAPLAISFRPSCGCTDLRPRVASIPPSDVLDVHIGVRLAEEPAEKVVRVAISSNDPSSPETSYMVRATCLPALALSPIAVNLGDVPIGRAARAENVVRRGNGGPLPPGGVVQAVSDSPHVSATVMPPAAGLDALVRLELSPAAPAGALRTQVAVSLEPGGLRVSVPVSANVVGPTALRRPSSDGPMTAVLSRFSSSSGDRTEEYLTTPPASKRLRTSGSRPSIQRGVNAAGIAFARKTRPRPGQSGLCSATRGRP